ncbi:MAG: hypothetical protein ACI9HY_003147, partial [Planctomycetaceae bacterium]
LIVCGFQVCNKTRLPLFWKKTATSGYYRGAFLQICMTSKRQQNLACGLWPGAFL